MSSNTSLKRKSFRMPQRLMFDTIKFRVPCMHKPFGPRHTRRLGREKTRWYDPVIVEGDFPEVGLTVRSLQKGQAISVEGSLAKFFQGHNVWGTAHLHNLCVAVLETLVRRFVHLTPTAADKAAWERGDIHLQRVDIARSFRLRDAEQVRRCCREIAVCLQERYPKKLEVYGEWETVYSGKASRRKTWKFYGKGRQLRHRAYHLSGSLPLRDRVQDYADRLLRAELTLRSTELEEEGLGRVRDWTGRDVAQLWEENFERLKLRGSVKRHLALPVLNSVPNNHRAAYQLHLDGNSLEPYFSAPTLRKIRRALLKLGIDVERRSLVNRSRFIPLQRLLRLENLARSSPRFACGTSLFFRPGRLSRT